MVSCVETEKLQKIALMFFHVYLTDRAKCSLLHFALSVWLFMFLSKPSKYH